MNTFDHTCYISTLSLMAHFPPLSPTYIISHLHVVFDLFRLLFKVNLLRVIAQHLLFRYVIAESSLRVNLVTTL